MNDYLADRPWQFVYQEKGILKIDPDGTPIGSHVERHALERPDSPALLYLNRVISYAQLNREANKFANALSSLEVGMEDVLGIQMPNIPQYVIAMVAASKMGLTVSNVSPLLAPSELADQVKDARISVMLAVDSQLSKIEAQAHNLSGHLKHLMITSASDDTEDPEGRPFQVSGIDCHSYAGLMENAKDTFSQCPVSLDDVAMLQYTGGTTGKPKGAMLTIGGIMYVVENSLPYTSFDEGTDVMASAYPFFHIAGVTLANYALRFGGLMMIIPDPRDIDHFCDQMVSFPPTLIAAVPTLLQMLMANASFETIDFSRLKIAVTGAAPITSETRHKLEAIIGDEKLSDAFGMTETAPTYVASPPHRLKPNSVGIPLPGTDVRIVDLDTGTRELPFCEEGEIIACTPGLMKGYLNLPEESAHAMRKFDGRTYMYSGDVGYMDDEGYVYICDRAKDMLIVGGFKVFSVEVEDKLASMECISQAAVIATLDTRRPGNDVVNLFVELSEHYKNRDKEKTERSIIQFCRESMSPYKVPKRIVFVESIPVTAVGKMDKKVMREMALAL